MLEKVYDMNNLLGGCERIKKASGWKSSTQKLYINKLRKSVEIHHKMKDGSYQQSRGHSFVLNEQGRKRLIKALNSQDMVVQHSLCDNVLIPEIRKLLIHDNGASLKGKGISFTRRRFEEHLHKYYRKYGNNGYILLIDFRKFFDNIKHEELMKKFIKDFGEDDKFIKFLRNILKSYRVDVSYSDDSDIINNVFNNLEYNKIDRNLLTKDRFMEKSMGIGSPISQISGLYFPTDVDNFCKNVYSCKYYGAYADDRYVLSNDKEFLKNLLEKVINICDSIGIYVHKNKTHIAKLSKGFTFLKTRYILTESGRLIKKVPRSVIVRERRKLKSLVKLVKAGKLTVSDFEHQYKSWRGDKKRYNSYNALKNMDKLFYELRGLIV